MNQSTKPNIDYETKYKELLKDHKTMLALSLNMIELCDSWAQWAFNNSDDRSIEHRARQCIDHNKQRRQSVLDYMMDGIE